MYTYIYIVSPANVCSIFLFIETLRERFNCLQCYVEKVKRKNNATKERNKKKRKKKENIKTTPCRNVTDMAPPKFMAPSPVLRVVG